jgi:hypothetical protein
MAFETTSTETLIPRHLYLQAQKKGVSYRAIGRLKGRKAGYLNTETGDREKAEKIARQWFGRWRNEAQGTPHHTMADAAKIRGASFPAKKAKARAEFLRRWQTIRSVVGLDTMDVRKVTSKTLEAFVEARRANDIGETTIKKEIYILRPILRAARREGWIDLIPELPDDVSVDDHPRQPFKAFEWQKIRDQMARDIADAKTERARAEAQFVSDGAYLIVLGLCRPTEWRTWTSKNVEFVTEPGRGTNVKWRGERKTGVQTFDIYSRHQRLTDILRRRVDEAKLASRDRLFPMASRVFSEGFGDLLDRLDLRHPFGDPATERTSASLRATGICQELARQRKKNNFADVLEIAKRAGTSVARIEKHYARFEDDINEGASGMQIATFAGLDGEPGMIYTGEDDY